jgi:adenine phosphoribosyltransferase
MQTENGKEKITSPYLELIDTKTTGSRYDVTPLFKQIDAFEALIRDLAHPFIERKIDLVAGIDALGFILGTGVALYLKKGFIPIRKGGKLPTFVHRVFFIDYSQQEKWLEMREDSIDPGQNILLVDEWIETGAQITAAVQMIEDQGGIIAGIAAINMDDNQNTRKLKKGYFCQILSTNL